MIELVITACLIAAPMACKDVGMTFFAPVPTPADCVFNGQLEASKWLARNPRYRVTRWRCGVVQTSQEM